MTAAQQREARRLARLARAFNRPGELRRLLGPERARQLQDEQRQVADCRRRAATNRELLDMRLR